MRRRVTVKFTTNDKGTLRKAAGGLHFTDGPLEGLKLIGFAIWRRGPARQACDVSRAQIQVNSKDAASRAAANQRHRGAGASRDSGPRAYASTKLNSRGPGAVTPERRAGDRLSQARVQRLDL